MKTSIPGAVSDAGMQLPVGPCPGSRARTCNGPWFSPVWLGTQVAELIASNHPKPVGHLTVHGLGKPLPYQVGDP